MILRNNQKKQAGQTLIETMVAIFIMVMGITAALGLATYSLHASTSISKQIIGVGLAREGLEAIKNMRDTNWLTGPFSNGTCYSFASGSNTGSCYQNWLSTSFDLSPGVYRIAFDASTSPYWQVKAANNNKFGLDTSGSTDTGLYTINNINGGSNPGTSGFYRAITIARDTSTPFNKADLGGRLLVTSQVWWVDKNCPASQTWPGSGKCSIQLQTYLTNWKNYTN